MKAGTKERRFLDALEALFTGAEVEGDSGFINLMRMKRGYFRSIRPKLMEAIDRRTKQDSHFREELFDKLHTFFSRYFCESGSIYFRHLPAFSKTYERVYAEGQDVALAWKTRMLYYVKSDVLVRSMPVTLDGEGDATRVRRFYFDASAVENKQNNERREFVFAFAQKERTPEGPVVHLKVGYSQKGRKTNPDAIIRQAKTAPGAKVTLTKDDLERAFRVFRRQTEADYFINKDARGFLREQFDLWLYQYMFQEETIFEQPRLAQLQAIQQTAYDIIDFIAQFEDELRRAWEKPKFVRNVNYVVTLDKLPTALLTRIARHPGAKAQIGEWREFGLVEDSFVMADLRKGQRELQAEADGPRNPTYRFLPLDTRHFRNLELEILDALGDLDEALDGELVHSENWQALNTLKAPYKEKVDCIYIDPPYNTDASAILYNNNYKDSSWLSLMHNRLSLSATLLSEAGILCCAIDDEEVSPLRLLMQGLFDRELGVVSVRSNPAGRKSKGQFSPAHEYALFFGGSAAVPGTLDKTENELARYPLVDDKSRYAWNNLIRHGSGYRREDRPKMFYPIYVNDSDALRIPAMKWDAGKQAYDVLEETRGNETAIWPTRVEEGSIVEKRWHRGYELVEKVPSEYRIRRGRDTSGCNGGISIDFKIRMDTNAMPKTWWDDSKYASANLGAKGLKNIFGAKDFDFAKAVGLVEDCLRASCCGPNSIVLDYFAGSGTTAHAVMNLNREDDGSRNYMLIEMGDYFHTVVLPRIKKVIYSKDWKDGKPISCAGVSHFLKYYTLEQYEETLKNSRYDDGEQLTLDSTKSPFEQYVFFGDDKLAQAAKPLKNGKLKINLRGIYPDVDIAESLANIVGKPIRCRTADSVTFADGTTEKTDPVTMTEEEKLHFVSLIRPYLWWGTS